MNQQQQQPQQNYQSDFVVASSSLININPPAENSTSNQISSNSENVDSAVIIISARICFQNKIKFLIFIFTISIKRETPAILV
jgi:hypothetical protein